MVELYKHFLYFIRKIRNVKKNVAFKPQLYFHSSFLSSDGKIAPKGKVNVEIQTKFKAFFNDFKKLDQSLKEEFYTLVLMSKDLYLFFEKSDRYEVSFLRNENIKRIIGTDSFKQLMESLWKYLSSNNAWEIDKHYEEFHKRLPQSKMCPFCGLEYLKIPVLRRADYDHLALKSKYPLSSIDLKNIAPSCDDCNETFKKEKDVFYHDNSDVRRLFSYPFIFNDSFQANNIKIDLSGSIIPDTDMNNSEGEWKINILPNDSYTQTWNDVYSIKKRYILSIKHSTWLNDLKKIINLHSVRFTNHDEVKNYLKKYKTLFDPKEIKIENHLKFSYYEFLENCNNNVLFEQIKQMSV
ncbi:hypothetical protein [Chryseobacterium rhizosphaerae]|nr:hypothetical protein [Chryseobacterium rhizosphaerae]